MKKSKTQALMVIKGGGSKPLKGDALIRAMAAVAVKDFQEKKEKALARMKELDKLWHAMARERYGKWFGLGKPELTDKPPRIQRDSYVYISCNVPTLELEPDAVALCKEYNDLADSIQRGYKYNDNPMAYEVARIKEEIAYAEMESVVGNSQLADNLRSLLKQLDSKPKAMAQVGG